MPVVKDLIPDLTHFYAQHASIMPWLETERHTAEANGCNRSRTARSWMACYECVMCALLLDVLPQLLVERRPVSGPGGAAARLPLDRATAAMRRRASVWTTLEDPFRLYRCHTIMNCTKTCPKGLNPAKAIAETKKMMVARQG